MKNANDSIRNRTHELPACSAVSQPTVPPSAQVIGVVELNPGQQMAEKVDKVMEFMLEQREEGRRVCELLEKNKSSCNCVC
jgi:hypothetical protein